MTDVLSTAARHSSESSEHWTPQNIVELARETMGAIDLDPASTIEANHRIRANIFHTREYDGFTKDWYGARVFESTGRHVRQSAATGEE